MPDMGQGDNFIDMFLILYFFYRILCGLEGIMKDNAFPGLDVTDVSSVVKPNTATFSPFTSSRMYG